MSFRIKSSNKIPFESAPVKQQTNPYILSFEKMDGQSKLSSTSTSSSTTQNMSTPRSGSSGGMAIRATRSIESDVR